MKNLSLLVKPAGLCNLNCRYCFYRAFGEGRDNGIMRPETARELIKKIGAYRPAALSVAFQGGEPTLAGLGFYRAFVEQVKETVACPVAFSMQTNGILIDGEWAAFFKENGFLVGVSLDGNRLTNDRYRRDITGESVYSRVLSAISVLQRYGVDFNILSVVDDKNAADIETTWRCFRQNGFRFLQFIPCIGGDVGLSPENYEAFLKNSFDLWYRELMQGRYVSVRHIDNYVGVLMGRRPESCAMCGFCGGYFVVEANGDLYPCDFYCQEADKLGGVFDEDPFGIHDKQRRFMEESAVIHARCRDCRYYALCRGGCKRDRTDGFTKNRYCAAYIGFFDYALSRMERAARAFLRGG